MKHPKLPVAGLVLWLFGFVDRWQLARTRAAMRWGGFLRGVGAGLGDRGWS